MTGRSLARLSLGLAVLLGLFLVGVGIGAWMRVLRPVDKLEKRSVNIEQLTWNGAIDRAGNLSVDVHVDLLRPAIDGGVATSARVFTLPEQATRLRIDRRPAPTDTGGNARLPRRAAIDLSYEVPGAVRRQGDRALLATDVVPSFGFLSNNFGYIDVRGWLTVARGEFGDGAMRFPGARQVRVDRAGPTLAFTGSVSSYDPAGLVVLLPGWSVPDLPASADARTNGFAREAAARSKDRIPDGVPVAIGRGPLVSAIVITLELVGIAIWWTLLLLLRRRRRRDHDDLLDDLVVTEPPSGFAPDLVAMMAAPQTGVVATREAVAGVLLAMVDRGTLRMDSLDSRRFLLRVPAEARGTTPTETAILAELRPQGQSGTAIMLEGPPLWAPGPQPWLGVVERDIRARARASHLVARPLRRFWFGLGALLVPVTALATGGGDGRVVGPGALALFAVAFVGWIIVFIAPVEPTAAGRVLRAEVRAFGRHVRSSGAFDHLGAPAVITRGPYLVYAAAVGEAPVAATDIGIGLVPINTAATAPR